MNQVAINCLLCPDPGKRAAVFNGGVRTSEKVSEQVLCFFLLVKMIAETASLELVARGRAMKEIKDGMCVALEKLWTASTSGSANAAAMAAPKSRNPTALAMHHPGFSTLSTASSAWPASSLCSCLVLCTVQVIRVSACCAQLYTSPLQDMEAPGRTDYRMEVGDELLGQGAADRHAALGLVEPFLHPLHELLFVHDFIAGRVKVIHDLINGIFLVEVNLIEVDPDDESMQLRPGQAAALVHVNLVKQPADEVYARFMKIEMVF
jgi:hypothetical protein